MALAVRALRNISLVAWMMDLQTLHMRVGGGDCALREEDQDGTPGTSGTLAEAVARWQLAPPCPWSLWSEVGHTVPDAGGRLDGLTVTPTLTNP
jgi:hypothetical protein